MDCSTCSKSGNCFSPQGACNNYTTSVPLATDTDLTFANKYIKLGDGRYYDLENQKIIDPTSGTNDLCQKVPTPLATKSTTNPPIETSTDRDLER